MKKSYTRFLSLSSSPASTFYKDRCYKLLPQYFLVLILTVLAYTLLGESTEKTYEGVSFAPLKVLFDATLLPLSLSVGSVANYLPLPEGSPIVPPAWSLSVESHYYLLVPLLVLLKRWALICITVISMITLTISFLGLTEASNINNFGYRNIVPMLCVFIYGMSFASQKSDDKSLAYCIWAYCCLLFLIGLPGLRSWYHFGVQEIVFGMILALPLFHFSITFRSDVPIVRKIDRLLGDLSYPLFLTHFLAIYLAQHFFGVSSFAKIYFFVSAAALAVVISYPLAMMQRSLDKTRIKKRGFNSLRDQG